MKIFTGKKTVWSIMQSLFFLFTGIAFLYFAFKGRDFSELKTELANINYYWSIPVLVVTVFNHYIRVLRWQLLIKPLGCKVSDYHAFMGLMIGYFSSYAVPRLGEIVRCYVLTKTDKADFKPLFGTVITERIVDTLSFFLLTFIVFITQIKLLADFFYENIFSPVWNTLKLKQNFIFIAFGLFVLLVVFYFIFSKKIHYFKSQKTKLVQFLVSIKTGMFTIFNMQRTGLFILYTVLIWVGYFFMTYFWIIAGNATSNSTLLAALTIMTIGSFGRSIPVQGGGMGAYHFLVTQAALIYGIAEIYGNVLAIIVHGFQTVFYLLLGSTFLILFLYQTALKTRKLKSENFTNIS